MTTILTTTGLSLYFNTQKVAKTKTPSDDQLRQYLRTEPVVASAEANSILHIAQKEDHLVLLHTDKDEAIRCAQLLSDFFDKRGFKSVRLVKLQFQDDEAHIETQGLRNLVDTLITEVEKAQKNNQEVIINATAGLKAQIVYSTMIGMIYQVPVKYMYETFRKFVTFTPIALDWDTNLFLSYQQFFTWVDDEVRSEIDVNKRLKAIAESDREKIQSMLTLPDSNQDVFLSAMGNVLKRRFERTIKEAEEIDFPPEVEVKNIRDKIADSIVKHGHSYPKWTEKACLKIAEIPYVQSIIPRHFTSVNKSYVAHSYPNGAIEVYWTEKDKTAKLLIQTTATGLPQTHKVVGLLKEILEIE